MPWKIGMGAGAGPGAAERFSHASGVGRRELLIGGAAAATCAGTIGLDQAGAGVSPELAPLQSGDRFQIVKGALKDEFLRPDLLEVDAAPVEGFPYDPAAKVVRRKNRLNRVLMLRLDPEEMDAETRDRSATGILVYSAICTHRNCTLQSWKAEERHLRCPCHLSEFAALSAGSVKNGPARRQLPMVPLGLDDDGFVIALAGFTRKPGGAKP